VRRPARPLSDGRVALRAWREADAPAMVAALADPEIPRWTRVPSPYTARHAREFLRRGDELEMSFAIVEAAGDGAILGGIGLRDLGDGVGQLGYWVAAGARRRGVASDALRLLAGWALEEAGMGRVQVLASVGNRSSQRTALRAGFEREGVLRGYLGYRGHREDAVIFGRVAAETNR